MAFKTIQDKINAKADTKLHTILVKAFDKFREDMQLKSGTQLVLKGMNQQEINITVATVLDKLQRKAFDWHQDAYRKLETEDFLSKIDSLTGDVEAINDELAIQRDMGKI